MVKKTGRSSPAGCLRVTAWVLVLSPIETSGNLVTKINAVTVSASLVVEKWLVSTATAQRMFLEDVM